MPDLSVFGKIKTKQDFDRERAAFELQKQLGQAQIKKAQQLDVDAIGEQAFMKAAMGQELSPQERAAAQVLDAKSGGVSFNPVTGEMMQKPRLSDKINIGGGDNLDKLFPAPTGGRTAPPMAPNGQNPYAGMGNPAIGQNYGDIIPAIDESMMGEPQKNEYDLAYESAMKQAVGNPKLQQSLTTEYLKGKTEYNVDQAKNAGFAQRIEQSLPLIEQNTQAGMSLGNKIAAGFPVFGNKMVPPEYQQFDQAKRDIINAILRRESGAVISPQEFENATIQYFPQYGDSEAVIAQKKKNLETALSGIQRGAGAAYRSYAPKVVTTGKPWEQKPLDSASQAETIFNAKKAIQKGADADMVRQRLIDAGIDPSKAGL